jgi:hypothetical protein
VTRGHDHLQAVIEGLADRIDEQRPGRSRRDQLEQRERFAGQPGPPDPAPEDGVTPLERRDGHAQLKQRRRPIGEANPQQILGGEPQPQHVSHLSG